MRDDLLGGGGEQMNGPQTKLLIIDTGKWYCTVEHKCVFLLNSQGM